MTYPFLSVPNISVYLELATSISLSWIFLNGSVVDSHEVMWTSDNCPNDVDEGSATTTETSYTIQGLREGSRYAITVIATTSTGTTSSGSVTGETKKTREYVDDAKWDKAYTIK